MARRLNLVGIINIVSRSQLVKSAQCSTVRSPGEIVIADEVSMERLKGVTESRSIRKQLYESVMLTACASPILRPATNLLTLASPALAKTRPAGKRDAEDPREQIARVN